MKLRIESDGTWQRTRVVNAETGEVLEGVRSIEWTQGLGGVSRAVLTVEHVELRGELEADVWSVLDEATEITAQKIEAIGERFRSSDELERDS